MANLIEEQRYHKTVSFIHDYRRQIGRSQKPLEKYSDKEVLSNDISSVGRALLYWLREQTPEAIKENELPFSSRTLLFLHTALSEGADIKYLRDLYKNIFHRSETIVAWWLNNLNTLGLYALSGLRLEDMAKIESLKSRQVPDLRAKTTIKKLWEFSTLETQQVFPIDSLVVRKRLIFNDKNTLDWMKAIEDLKQEIPWSKIQNKYDITMGRDIIRFRKLCLQLGLKHLVDNFNMNTPGEGFKRDEQILQSGTDEEIRAVLKKRGKQIIQNKTLRIKYPVTTISPLIRHLHYSERDVSKVARKLESLGIFVFSMPYQVTMKNGVAYTTYYYIIPEKYREQAIQLLNNRELFPPKPNPVEQITGTKISEDMMPTLWDLMKHKEEYQRVGALLKKLRISYGNYKTIGEIIDINCRVNVYRYKYAKGQFRFSFHIQDEAALGKYLIQRAKELELFKE